MIFSNLQKKTVLVLIVVFQLMAGCTTSKYSSRGNKLASFYERISSLESSSGGRIGIFSINTGSRKKIQYRADETFPLWSTHKVMTVAAVLKKNITDPGLLKEQVTYSKDDLKVLGYAPITEKYINEGMTVSELCAATIQYSDNAAANLLMRKLGGADAVTKFARSVGDDLFQFYSLKSDLKLPVYPTNLRVKSTPAMVGKSLERLVLGNVLAKPQREQLEKWLKGNTTGDSRIRAGVPNDWIVGDKTGTGSEYGITNDIAVIWPPNAAPLILTIFFLTKDQKDTVHHDEVVASATRLVIDAIL